MIYTKGEFTVVPTKTIEGKSPYIQCIYMWMCKYSNENGECFPSQNTLAKNCGISLNACRKYIKEMKELGLISVERRYKNGEEISSLYNLVICPPQNATPPPQNATPSPTTGGTPPPPRGDELYQSKLNQGKKPLHPSLKNYLDDPEKQNTGLHFLMSKLLLLGWIPSEIETLDSMKEWFSHIMSINKQPNGDMSIEDWKNITRDFYDYWIEQPEKERKKKIWKTTFANNPRLPHNKTKYEKK